MAARAPWLTMLSLLMAGGASAQTTGTITGVVTDGATGKPVAGAHVVAASPAVAGQQTAVTDTTGSFILPDLPAGPYELMASLEGYQPETRAGLTVGDGVTLRAALALTAVTATARPVLVTGSRLRRMGLTTDAPVAVISREAITASGQVSIGDYLNTMPAAVAARGRGNTSGGDGTVRISLRGLGAARTLVLVNGRRWVPGGSGANASVDLDTLPASAIERIEVLKDGASAVYGSDAIGGVINVITRTNFNGAEFSASSGTSSRGDGTAYDVRGTFGVLGDRGSVLLSAGFARQEAVWAGDRSWSKDALWADYTGIPPEVHTLSSSTIPNGRFRVDLGSCGTNTVCQDLATAFGTGVEYLTWTGNTAVNHGYKVYSGVTDTYNYAPSNYLYTPSQRYNFFTSGDYRLNDYAKFYFEGSFMNRKTDQKLAPVPLVADQFNPPGIVSAASQYNPFGQDLLVARSRLTNLSNRLFAQDTDTVRLVTGLSGTFAKWYWDASYSFGRTAGTDTTSNVVRTDLVAAALGPSSGGKCYSVATPDPANPGQYIYSGEIPGCIPLNLLQGPAPANQIAGIAFTGPNRGFTQEAIWAANASGELISLMADRPVAVAVGVEHRSEAGASIPNPFSAAGLGSDSNFGPTQGSYSVNEAFAEFSIPIINNSPMIYDLEATLAGRYSNYSTYGTNSTYKAGLRYSPVRDVTVRGTYSTAFRAPAIAELYAGTAEIFPAATDPCHGNPAGPGSPGYVVPTSALGINCGAAANNGDVSSSLRAVIGGNPKLKAETARTFTIGLVLEPRFIDHFSLALGFYDTTVEGTIGAVDVVTILDGCYFKGHKATCALVNRDPTTQYITAIDGRDENSGELRTAGLDIAARYRLDTAGLGTFAFNAEGTLLLKDDWTRPDGSTVHARGTYDFGYADPKFKGQGNVQWSMAGLTAGLGARYIGGFKECGDIYGGSATGNICLDTPTYFHMVSSYWNFNANVGYGFASSQGKTSITLGVTNLMNQDPPKNYNALANAADTAYDYMGRFYYARVSHAF